MCFVSSTSIPTITTCVLRFVVYKPCDYPIGPHPIGMWEAQCYTPDQFGMYLPWLCLNHSSHSILIHPNTGDEYKVRMKRFCVCRLWRVVSIAVATSQISSRLFATGHKRPHMTLPPNFAFRDCNVIGRCLFALQRNILKECKETQSKTKVFELVCDDFKFPRQSSQRTVSV